jgi:uncharacterized protein (DUF58 family)
MRWLRGIFARWTLTVTPRAALLVAVPAAVVLFLPAPYSGVLAAAWLVAAGVLVWRDADAAPRSSELEWRRELPAKLSIGVPNQVTLSVHNASGKPASITARETPPAGFAGERTVGPLDVPARGDAEVTLSFTPPGRGLYRFGGVGVRSVGPRGLAGWLYTAPIEEDAKVYPDIQAVKSYSLLARRGALAELGVKKIRFAGAGTEFESLREYQRDDDYRDIDWKATARRGKPVVRSFESERSQTMVLAVDAGRLMTPRVGTLAKLDRAVNAALLLAYLGTERDDLVGLLVFGRDVIAYLPPRKGHRQFLAILEALYSVEGTVEEPDYGRALRYLAARLKKRSLVVLFTDLVGAEPSKRLIDVLAGLSPRHLPLVITQRNRVIEAKALADVATETDAFSAAVAEDVLRDKAAALRVLSSRGAMVLDVHPEELSVAAVNRYLEVKARGRL